jgi:hypothetical protein
VLLTAALAGLVTATPLWLVPSGVLLGAAAHLAGAGRAAVAVSTRPS